MLNGILQNTNLSNSEITPENNVVQIAEANKKYMTNPIQSQLIDETDISENALKLYQRDLDIKKFTNLTLSDSKDTSHLDIIEKQFAEGVMTPFSDDLLGNLLNNQLFLKDIAF